MARVARAVRHLRQWLTHRSAFRVARRQLLGNGQLSDTERRLIETVNTAIHPLDAMYDGDARHYLSVGLSAIRNIDQALKQRIDAEPVRRILDFPCGYGRVLRCLRAAFPEAEITAAEIQPRALKFCARRFGVRPFASHTALSQLHLDDRFDLIWCGSLLTHIDQTSSLDLLRFFHKHLASGGVCVFTTHGRKCVERLQSGELAYGLAAQDVQQVIQDFEQRGFGYADYPGRKGLGTSAVKNEKVAEWAATIGDWKPVLTAEQGWDNHQDVYAFAAR